jgi:hypothetical protein
MAILAEMVILSDMVIPVEMTAPKEETILEEAIRKHPTIVGSEAISEMFVFTTNERRKQETVVPKDQRRMLPLEIKIPSDYAIMLSPPSAPIQFGSSTSGPLTIGGTIAASSSYSRNYTDLWTWNLAMMTL